MGFPEVIVECGFNSILPEATTAPTGFTEITKFVDSISGTLRGRSYELDDIETGSISLTLDNADGRFTPGSPLSPYFPYVKANRRLRIRGKNLQRLNIARAGGQEDSVVGFMRNSDFIKDASDGVTIRVTEPVLATHNAVTLGFTGELLGENTHIEATVQNGAAGGGTYRILSWWAPLELGVRLSHSVYVWKVSGTEPSSSTVAIRNLYYDGDGNIVAKPDGDSSPTWTSQTPTSPTRKTWSDLPPGDALYVLQTLEITNPTAFSGDVTYAVAGVQSEVSATNYVPSISGYYDASAWSVDGAGTVAKQGASVALAYLQTTWAADDTELATSVRHLVPGDEYTFVVEAQKSGGPDVLLSADDGLTGVTLSSNSAWTTLRTTFTSPRAEQPIKFIPQGAVVAGQTLWLRKARLAPSDPALALATAADDSEVTAWTRPIPVFDGWVERWPIKTTASSSTITITVNDRLKKLGEVSMESTLKQTLLTDSPALLIPFTDDAEDAQGQVSVQGDWADDAGISQLAPTQTKYGAGASTFTPGGMIGPTGEDALTMANASQTQGYCILLPYSADYTIPVTPPPVVVKPVPKPTIKTNYKKSYYATWSRSYDGSDATRFNDPDEVYQGDVGDSNGNQKSLIGFNWNAINADLKGASVTGAFITVYAIHWWYYAGGTVYLGTHTYTSKPSTYNTANVFERRWNMKMQRNAWRTMNIGVAGGVLFQKGTGKGVSIGWGNGDDHETYGYLAGAKMSHRPYITIWFRK